jgi:membrane protease YdiL (CAAX protease family)
VLSIAVIAPLAEEIVFRGYIFRAVENKAGGYVAIILTALAFAILHFSPVLVIPIFLMGLAMGWVRERTGSIVPSLIFHSANNLSAVVLISVS